MRNSHSWAQINNPSVVGHRLITHLLGAGFITCALLKSMPSIPLTDERYNTFFLTLKIIKDINIFVSKKYFDIIISSLDYCQKHKGIHILAYAILSNHLHLIFWMDEEVVLKDVIRDFKHFTAKQIIKLLQKDKKFHTIEIFKEAALDTTDRKCKVWRRTTHPEAIYFDKFLEQKVRYVDYNAAHHGIVEDIEDYLYTSYHNHYCQHETVLKLI